MDCKLYIITHSGLPLGYQVWNEMCCGFTLLIIFSSMDSKTCKKCLITKPIEEFHNKTYPNNKQYRASTCKVCDRLGCKRYYTHNKKKSLDNQNKRRKKALEFFRALKEQPCADCGNRFHPCVMDFDHREGEIKLFGIGRDYYKHPKEQVLAEIEKCDLVCANCHRMRTFNRRNNNESK